MKEHYNRYLVVASDKTNQNIEIVCGDFDTMHDAEICLKDNKRCSWLNVRIVDLQSEEGRNAKYRQDGFGNTLTIVTFA